VALWQVFSSTGWIPARKLASPWAIVQQFRYLSGTGELQSALSASIVRVLLGASIGVTVGLVLGVISGRWRVGEETFDAIIQMLRTLPFLALVPLFIIWFGIGQTPKLTLIAYATALPVYLNTFAGIRNVDTRLVEMATSFGVTGWRLAVQVVLFGAMPSILVGLRLALGYAWLSLVIAETINANNGLGLLLTNAQNNFDIPELLVGLVCYAFLGLATDLLVRFLERRLLKWRQGFAGI